MPRDQGRNAKKVFLGSGQTMQMVQFAEGVIDREIRNGGGRMVNLKDIVFDELVMNLTWWNASWVDYPGFCAYGSGTHGAWVCIRMWWAKQNPGRAIRDEEDSIPRPGLKGGVWYVINSWDEAMPIVSRTILENAARSANDLVTFETLVPAMGNRAVLKAMQAGVVFSEMHLKLIERATFISSQLAAAGTAGLGWVREYDAIQAVESGLGFSNAATHAAGHELWLVHP
jgi:hypothetical protein